MNAFFEGVGMGNERERKIADRFKTEALPKVVEALKSASADLAKKPLTDFKNAIDGYVRAALNNLLKIAGLQKLENLSLYLSATAAAEIVSGLNSALPLDYPYIVCVLNVEDEKATLFMCMRRSKIPGMHDLLSQNVVPICQIKTRADLFAPGLKFNVDFGSWESPAD